MPSCLSCCVQLHLVLLSGGPLRYRVNGWLRIHEPARRERRNLTCLTGCSGMLGHIKSTTAVGFRYGWIVPSQSAVILSHFISCGTGCWPLTISLLHYISVRHMNCVGMHRLGRGRLIDRGATKQFLLIWWHKGGKITIPRPLIPNYPVIDQSFHELSGYKSCLLISGFAHFK